MRSSEQKEHEKWIRRCFELALKGIQGASPNPLVGCVIVKNGRMVGEGFHAQCGGPHAEINALKIAGEKAEGATLYTNLEPCSHWGKTPPCADAIIKAGIKKVVSSILDPYPLVRGQGFKKIKKAGIAIKKNLLKKEAEGLNRSFIKFVTQKKPYVVLKSAISLDGKIAGSSGNSKWITSKDSREFSYRLRTQFDGILAGAETVRKDNPSLTSHGYGRNPVRIVLSKTGCFSENLKIFDGKASTWLICNSSKNRNLNAERIRIQSHHEKINPESILRILAKKGISKLLIEGGGETAAEFLEAREVDEVYFFVAPVLIGGKDAKTAFEGRGFKDLSKAARLTDCSIKMIGKDWLINGHIKK